MYRGSRLHCWLREDESLRIFPLDLNVYSNSCWYGCSSSFYEHSYSSRSFSLTLGLDLLPKFSFWFRKESLKNLYRSLKDFIRSLACLILSPWKKASWLGIHLAVLLYKYLNSWASLCPQEMYQSSLGKRDPEWRSYGIVYISRSSHINRWLIFIFKANRTIQKKGCPLPWLFARVTYNML